jgi:hypothetical protein
MSLDSRATAGTSTPVWWALLIFIRYRSRKNFKDPLFLSARVVDKAIVASIIVSLFHSQVSLNSLCGDVTPVSNIQVASSVIVDSIEFIYISKNGRRFSVSCLFERWTTISVAVV